MSANIDGLLQRHRLNVHDYHRMGETGILTEEARVELIDGEIIDMTPIGSQHAAVVKRLNRLFDRVIGERAILSIQDPIVLDNHSEPEPDVALLYPRDDFYAAAHPHADDVLLIIEVAATTLRYDREVKVPLYARFGIPEIWLVDLENSVFEVFRQPEAAIYSKIMTLDPTARIEPQLLPECGVELHDVFGP